MSILDQLEKKDGTALVLSGGATKAFYFHLGVLQYLGEGDIPDNISSVVGTSAGSVLGSLIASGVTPEILIKSLRHKTIYIPQLDRKVRRLTSSMLFKPKYLNLARQTVQNSMETLKFLAILPALLNRDILAEVIDRAMNSQEHVAGFFDAKELEMLFRSLLPSQAFFETKIDLYVTATTLDGCVRAVFNSVYDMEDERNCFKTNVPIARAVKASSAVPGMFEPVKIQGRYYVDGEIRRSLSADIAARLADRVVISHTYQPMHLHDNGESLRQMGWVNIVRQSLYIALHERISVWRDVYEREFPEKTFIYIHPDPDDIEFFQAPEFSFRQDVQTLLIERGYRAAQRALEMTNVT